MSRHREVRDALDRARMATQPYVVGKPLRLGNSAAAPLVAPPLPYANAYWKGDQELCVAEDQKRGRCFALAVGKWSPLSPWTPPRQEEGSVEIKGGGNPCNYVNICWHQSLTHSPGHDLCEGFECVNLVAALPGPRLVLQQPSGLVEILTDLTTRPIAGAVTREVLSRMPGGVFVDGIYFFDGPELVDGRNPGRSWKVFDGILPDATSALVSPSGKWAAVSFQNRSPEPPSLYLVPLAPRG